ncbi:MAG TPA: ABC transporter permease [Clostridiaceae bacterium]|nr:ABC transporter permease [Clostridiaceae bacterium]HBF76428.1 ABC transporter permease [Clostridiaceae bacterium]HBG39480.1 ABC transporter permease [Clostridiaceae bacterium]HBN28179.1 ABC transporter permease [Clostridiaceae bacterium]HBX47895.1 ABC transporter permease [Clostridiaceae bacterium]
MAAKINKILFDNMVTILFIVLCIIEIILSGQSAYFILNELVARIARNSFLVLSLIIPVIAGMGLNFGIVIGAMAAQAAIIAVAHWQIKGILGFLLCILLSTPLAILLGYITGKLLNKTKGQEMIASMIFGFFANGIYQLIFLLLIGTIIPMKDPVIVLSSGVGIKNTIDLSGSIKYSLDNLIKLPLSITLAIICFGFMVYYLWKYIKKREKKNLFVSLLFIIAGGCFAVIYNYEFMLNKINVPIATMLLILALCFFNNFICSTKLGQNFKAVGQNMHIAGVSGINVDKVRVNAIIISTVLAAWGQLIFLQNIGTLNTYGSHEQVGMFAIASLLIGGATVTNADNKQAIIGTILFHTMFIVSPMAGKNLFGNAQIGEYFRVFVVYGVIGVSLGLHAWKNQYEKNKLMKQ